MTASAVAQRVAISHRVAERVDEITANVEIGYQSLTDVERVDRLEHCLDYVALDGLESGELSDALVRLMAEAQAWLEALVVEAAR